MKKLLTAFDLMSRQEILSQKPGKWGDFELLDVITEFEEQDEYERMMAVYELILGSPEVSETVDYGELYEDLVDYYLTNKDFLNAHRWLLAGIAYTEKHAAGENRLHFNLLLADSYLRANDLQTGLAIFTVLIQSYPHSGWIYYSMGSELVEMSLCSLAVEVFDMGLRLITGEEREELYEDLSDARRKALEMIGAGDQSGEIDQRILEELRATLKWVESEPSMDEENEPYPTLLNSLIQDDANQLPTIKTSILEQGMALAPGLIRLAFDAAQPAASDRAVALLRQVAESYPGEFSLLREWLDQAQGEWHTALYARTMGKVRGYTTAEIQEVAGERSYDLGVRLSALEALNDRVEKFPDQKAEVTAYLCSLLERPESYLAEEEEANAWVIDTLTDIDAIQAYPLIRQAFDQDRVHPGVIDLNYIHEKFGMDQPRAEPPREGMYLPLICKACGRTRVHYVDYVIVEGGTLDRQDEGEETLYDAHIMDHPIICPKCGSIDRYELTFQSLARIEGPDFIDFLLSDEHKKKRLKPKDNPRVFYIRTSVFGKEMHPLEGLAEYHRRIAQDPMNAELYVRMGNLLRSILRYDQALEAHRQAVVYAPDDPEVLLAAAYSEHDIGDTDVAMQHYTKLIQMDIRNIKGFSTFPRGVLAKAVEGLNALQRGQWSPNDLYFNTISGKRVTHPSFTLKNLKPFHAKLQQVKSHPKKKTKRGQRKHK